MSASNLLYEAVYAASRKNVSMTANPNRSLRDVVLQRQVWSYLKIMLDNDIATTTHEDKPSVFNHSEMQQPPKTRNTHTFEIAAQVTTPPPQRYAPTVQTGI